MNNDALALIAIGLFLSVMLLAVHVRDLHQRLDDANQLLAIQQAALKHWYRMATGGAFADFINSLSIDHQERKR